MGGWGSPFHPSLSLSCSGNCPVPRPTEVRGREREREEEELLFPSLLFLGLIPIPAFVCAPGHCLGACVRGEAESVGESRGPVSG